MESKTEALPASAEQVRGAGAEKAKRESACLETYGNAEMSAKFSHFMGRTEQKSKAVFINMLLVRSNSASGLYLVRPRPPPPHTGKVKVKLRRQASFPFPFVLTQQLPTGSSLCKTSLKLGKKKWRKQYTHCTVKT